MTSWETTHTQSEFGMGDKFSNITSGRNRDDIGDFSADGAFGGYGQETYNDWQSPFHYETKTEGYDIIGINGNHIPAMREAITTYVEAAQTYLKDAIEATQEQIATAFRGGDVEAATKQYLDKVKEYVHNLISTLLVWNDKLADVGNAWVNAQASFGQNVNTDTGSFSAGTTYTDNNVTYSGPSR